MTASNSRFKEIENLLEELPETFRSAEAAEKTSLTSKKLNTKLKQYADQTESNLNRINHEPVCYSKHNLNLTDVFAQRGLDLLNKSVQTIWENGEMSEEELRHMKHYAKSDELYTQMEIAGELKDVLDEQYPGIEYDEKEKKFQRVD